MLTKQNILKSINELPYNFTFEELLDKIILINKIEIGLEQSLNNQIYSSKEAKRYLSKWLR